MIVVTTIQEILLTSSTFLYCPLWSPLPLYTRISLCYPQKKSEMLTHLFREKVLTDTVALFLCELSTGSPDLEFFL